MEAMRIGRSRAPTADWMGARIRTSRSECSRPTSQQFRLATGSRPQERCPGSPAGCAQIPPPAPLRVAKESAHPF